MCLGDVFLLLALLIVIIYVVFIYNIYIYVYFFLGGIDGGINIEYESTIHLVEQLRTRRNPQGLMKEKPPEKINGWFHQ